MWARCKRLQGIREGTVFKMKVTNRGEIRRRTVAFILSGMLVMCVGFPDGKIVCEAKGEEQEVIDFVTSYYKAESPEGIETLADYVDDPESGSFRIDLLRLRETLKHGVKGWENIKVLVCPMSDGKHWVVSASGEMIIEDFDVGIPGLRVMLVGKNKEGELKIASYAYDPETDSDAFIKEMRELSLSDEIVEHSNEIAAAFNELISERPDIMEWTLETNEAVEKQMAEELAREDALSETADSKEEKSTAGKDSYIVQKGDCLWDIAEEQLGDGMRWSSLYEQNKEVIGDNPDLIYVGITLQLD